MQQRVERRAAHAGQVRTDLRAFAVELVADETSLPGDLMARVKIERAVQYRSAFRGNQFQLVGVRFAKTPDGFGRPFAQGIVLRLKQGADDGDWNLRRGDCLLLDCVQEDLAPAGARSQNLGGGAPRRGRKIRPAVRN